MLFYLENIYRAFFPAHRILATTQPPEYTALLQLGDIIERYETASPKFLAIWGHAYNLSWSEERQREQIELERSDHHCAPTLSIRRGAGRALLIPLPLFDAFSTESAVARLIDAAEHHTASIRIAILPNRYSRVATPLERSLNNERTPGAEGRWIVTDWIAIAEVVSRFAAQHELPAVAAYARFLTDDFRISGALVFSESLARIAIADILSGDCDEQLLGVSGGLVSLLSGSAKELLETRITILSGDRYTPHRYAVPGRLLRRIAEGQLNGRWSDVPWDILAGSWPYSIAKRLVTADERHFSIVGDISVPWNPVQLAYRSE